jgi:dihydroceramidase
MFLYLAIRGLYSVTRYSHGGIFTIAYLGYLVVGSGSFAFHSTLKYPMQLIDELSMIYTTSIMLYASFERESSTTLKYLIATFLTAVSVGVTGYYHYVEEPIVHQVSYGLLTAALVFRSLYVMEVNLRPSRRTREQELAIVATVAKTPSNGAAAVNGSPAAAANNGTPVSPAAWPQGLSAAQIAELKRIDARDKQILKTMYAMIGYGLSVFLGGFLIWNLDNAYCSKLRSWRHEIGLPWGILLEGHGWW